MFRHILLPTDGSACSEKSVNVGIELAKTIGARVLGFHAVPPFFTLSYLIEVVEAQQVRYETEAAERAKRYLEYIEHAAQVSGVICECEYRFAEHPYQAITDVAEERDCDLIVMGSHGRHGAGRLLLGSVTHRVLLRSNLPTMVCP
jgi:nucleotide-binding universal stress UspA family protein